MLGFVLKPEVPHPPSHEMFDFIERTKVLTDNTDKILEQWRYQRHQSCGQNVANRMFIIIQL